MPIDFSGNDAQSQALTDAILKSPTPGPLKLGAAGPAWSRPSDPIGALYQQILKGAMPGVVPGSLGTPNSLMQQQGRMHPPNPYRRSPGFQSAINQSINRDQGPGYNDPYKLASGLGSAGIAGYQGYKQAARPDATEADRAAGTAGAISGGATAASTLLPGWYGKIAQLAGLMAGEYSKDKTADARGQRTQQILRLSDEKARQGVLNNEGYL